MFACMWRDAVDPVLKDHLEEIVRKVANEKRAYTAAKSPTKAQLWCALAVLAKEVSDLQLKVDHLEKQAKKKENTSLKKALEKF